MNSMGFTEVLSLCLQARNAASGSLPARVVGRVSKSSCLPWKLSSRRGCCPREYVD